MSFEERNLFFLGLVIRLILGCVFASEFLTELFIPFVNHAYDVDTFGVYDFFSDNGKGNEFPYPPLMLYILLASKAIFFPFLQWSAESSILNLAIFRLPMIIFDILILRILMEWFRNKPIKVLIYYWFSPILIFISYIHGQLDIIPIGLLFISLYFLFKENWLGSFFFLAFSVCCKLNIIIVIPFVVWYTYRSNFISHKQVIGGILIVLIVFSGLLSPFVSSSGFISMVLQNPEQSKVFDSYLQINSSVLKIYFIPAAYFILLIRLLRFKFFNRDLAILSIAFSFGILTIFIPPMQGWYFWTIPFFIYFMVQQDESFRLSFVFINVFYFIYFSLNSDFYSYISLSSFIGKFATNNDPHILLVSVVFTLLQTSVFVFCIWIYQKGILQIMTSKILYSPFLLGIGGDSGAGKTTLSNNVVSVFGSQNSSILKGDDMHKWERGNANWLKFTHLNPKANFLHNDRNDLNSLKQGRKIYRREYDHTNGGFNEPKLIKPNKLVIFEGLHPFYLSNQNSIYDLKIYLKPEEKLRRHWKILRDTKQRGYKKEKVIHQIENRINDSEKFIKVQEENADIIVSVGLKGSLSTNQIGSPTVTKDEILEVVCANSYYLENLTMELGKTEKLQVEHFYERKHQILQFDGCIMKNEVFSIASKIFPDLDRYGIYNSDWKSGYDGILQLMICQIIINQKS
jgi:uridine kinase